MLYEDNSSKKRTASSLAEQRQQITSLSSPVEKKEPSYEQQPVQVSYAASPETKYQAPVPQPTNPQYQYNNYEYQQQPKQQQQQQPSPSQPVQYAADTSQSVDNSLNNSAYVIASSLNYVYDDTNQSSYSTNSQDVTLQPDESAQPNYYVYENGAVLPLNFARTAKNTHEPWTVPLCLEEPFDANRKCMYAKHLVYPGDGNEYSLEEIRGRKWYRRLEDLREKKRLQKQQQEMEKQRQQMVRQQQHEERRQRELYMQQQQVSGLNLLLEKLRFL
jgi:hypothetical protein